jgi:hypothetical protein
MVTEDRLPQSQPVEILLVEAESDRRRPQTP